jgi:hypothetical protein
MKHRAFPKAILMLLVVCRLLLSCTTNDAREYSLAIYGPVHVYPSSTPPADYPGSDFIAVIGTGDRVQVMQVMQMRDHVAVRIRLHDGREGWVFSGESIEVRLKSTARMKQT